MKNNGLERVKETLDNRIITKLKYVSSINGRIGFRGYTQNDLVDEGDGAITISPSNIKGMNTDFSKCTYVSWYKYNESPEIKVCKGDIILVKTGSSYGKSALIQNLPQPATINPQLVVLKDIKINKKILFYFLQTDFVKRQMDLAVIGGAIPTMTQVKIGDTILILPPISEQKVIAEFLDKKCGEVDALIAEIQQEIETLEQYKRSVITESVTKGLDPSVPMKDSGIDWLGMQPSQWEHYKGKYIFEQRNERGNQIELQLLSPTQNYGVIPQTMYEEFSGMNAVKLNERVNLNILKTIHKGDYCISLRSFQGGFEYSQYEGVVSPAYQVFYPTRAICEEYYKYLFKEKSFIAVMNSYTLSLRDGKNIAFSDFGNTMIPYPPIEEQQQIADYLDKKCKEIEEIIADKQSQIETLESYKKSLIYEYVTGKKEVE